MQTDQASKVIKISCSTRKTVWQNIALAFGVNGDCSNSRAKQIGYNVGSCFCRCGCGIACNSQCSTVVEDEVAGFSEFLYIVMGWMKVRYK